LHYLIVAMTLRSSAFKRLLTPPLVVLVTAWMLVEEYLWHGLVRLGAWIGRLRPIARLEAHLAACSPPTCLAVLLVPIGLGVLIELVALWLIAAGHALAGVVLLVAAKLVPTALVARIYTICEPKLEAIAWFVRVRDLILAAKNWAHCKLEVLPAWRVARQFLRSARQLAARVISLFERHRA